jgi:hypothetical protein
MMHPCRRSGAEVIDKHHQQNGESPHRVYGCDAGHTCRFRINLRRRVSCHVKSRFNPVLLVSRSVEIPCICQRPVRSVHALPGRLPLSAAGLHPQIETVQLHEDPLTRVRWTGTWADVCASCYSSDVPSRQCHLTAHLSVSDFMSVCGRFVVDQENTF